MSIVNIVVFVNRLSKMGVASKSIAGQKDYFILQENTPFRSEYFFAT